MDKLTDKTIIKYALSYLMANINNEVLADLGLEEGEENEEKLNEHIYQVRHNNFPE